MKPVRFLGILALLRSTNYHLVLNASLNVRGERFATCHQEASRLLEPSGLNMNFRDMRSTILENKNAPASMVIAILFMLSGYTPSIGADSQDYCIKCANPEQTYICRIVSNSSQSKGKQFLCIMNIAKEHGHDSCTVNAQSEACSGVLVQYEVSGSDQPQIPRMDINTNPAPVAPPPSELNPNGEPKTLIEFTKKATKATKKSMNSVGKDTSKAIKNTGKAIGNTGGKIKSFTSKVGSNIKSASKTTWKCITSLFFSCGSE